MREPGPMFTIVVPVFNRASSIEPTFRSVKAQSFADWECVVVDDGSSDTDSLESVIEQMHDPRFRLVRRQNGGGGAARNSGVEAGRGQFVAFLDSDDMFMPNKLEVFASVVEQRIDRGWYSRTLVDRGGGRSWIKPSRPIGAREDMGSYLFVHNEVIQTSTIVLSRELALKVVFDPDLRRGQDLDLCLRLHAAGVSFEMVDEPLAIWVDQSEVGRTSRYGGYRAPEDWLSRSSPLLTHEAVLGYRANVLAYFMAGERPLVALFDILNGWARGGVPTALTLRQLLRCFLPRAAYRSLVDTIISIRGGDRRRQHEG